MTQRNRLMIILPLVAMLAMSASPVMAKKTDSDHVKSHSSATHIAAGNTSKGSGSSSLSTALAVFNGLIGGLPR
jgi:ABC-type oligopeptide transport system substrate-binding subunit